ncbi:PAS domain-containing protein [Brucella sp. ZJ1_1]|uniref:histidine kinase n=1 Tax=Brucella intermedia LMG 3301 TaxID=641118 RepID=C4WQB7_9HYPH|nr:PAS domain-containing protein [Brucella intermedia]EEQ94458.1 PAS domain S-box-containing protein [Brucella intermedia LMG 3301]OOC65258.1 PAS domain-containing sensor histidine kinase [Brucella intermedia M86]QNQ42414.1 PAS domain-containing protein [Brucella intermedia]SUA87361.1 Sensor protein fixL [Brucella intermedia]
MTLASTLNVPGHNQAIEAARTVERVVGNAWATDSAGGIIYMTESMLSLVGFSLDQFNEPAGAGTRGWSKLIHPDDYAYFAATRLRSLETGERYAIEHRVLSSSGAYRWCRSAGEPVRDKGSRIVGWYGTVIDAYVPSITGERFTHATNASLDGVTQSDTAQRLDLTHPDDQLSISHATARAFWTGVPQITRHRRRQPDGSYRWIETRSEPGYSVSVEIGNLVTERDSIPRSVAGPSGNDEAEPMRSAMVVESIFGNGWAFDATGRWIFLHPFAQSSLGVSLDYLNEAVDEGHTAWKRLLHPDDYHDVAKRWLHCLATGEDFNVEFRFRRASDVYVWARTAARAVRDHSGRIAGWYGIALDNDVYKKTVTALREREKSLQQLIDTVPAMVWSTSSTGTPTYVNKRFIEVTGARLQDISAPDNFLNFSVIHPDDVQKARDAMDYSLATNEPYLQRYRQIRADGSYRWTETRAEPLRDETGTVVQWYGVCVDIDDLVAAQKSLSERERELSMLVDMVPSFIWRLNAEGEPDYFNKRLIDFCGVRIDDLGGAQTKRRAAVIEKIIHPDDLEGVSQALSLSINTGKRFSMRYRVRRADGVYRWVSGQADPLRDNDGRIVQWYGLSTDIDDQVKAEDALKQSERRYRDLFQYMPIALTQIDAQKLAVLFKELRSQGVEELRDYIDEHPDFLMRAVEALEVEEVNDHILGMFGASSPSEMYGSAGRYWQPGLDTIRRSIEARYRGEEVFQEETKVMRLDGSVIDVLFTTARPDAVADKSLVGFIDITQRKKAEEALQERERSLWRLVEALPVMIDCADANGEPIYRSDRLCEFLGFGLDQLEENRKLRTTLDAGVHPDDLQGVLEQYAHCLATGEPYARRHRLRRFDGQYRWVETRAEAMRDGSGNIVQWNVICLDIDREVRAQEELRLTLEKLARASQASSLAELSASIAHEVNQPLAAIVANSHACQRWLMAEPPNTERALKTVERITRDATSAAEIVGRIRALFKQSFVAKKKIMLSDIISEVRDLMAEELTRWRIRTVVDAADGLPFVMADKVQIQQVILNLIRNAVEAMETVSDRLLTIEVVRDEDVVRTKISDRGVGISPTERMFEPFITTKEQGMGMGLAISRSIVEAHGGRLWAEKNEPQGTSLVFTLPVVMKAVAV